MSIPITFHSDMTDEEVGRRFRMLQERGAVLLSPEVPSEGPEPWSVNEVQWGYLLQRVDKLENDARTSQSLRVHDAQRIETLEGVAGIDDESIEKLRQDINSLTGRVNNLSGGVKTAGRLSTNITDLAARVTALESTPQPFAPHAEHEEIVRLRARIEYVDETLTKVDRRLKDEGEKLDRRLNLLEAGNEGWGGNKRLRDEVLALAERVSVIEGAHATADGAGGSGGGRIDLVTHGPKLHEEALTEHPPVVLSSQTKLFEASRRASEIRKASPPVPMVWAAVPQPETELGLAALSVDGAMHDLVMLRAQREYAEVKDHAEVESLSASLLRLVRQNSYLGRPADTEYARVIYHLAAGYLVSIAFDVEGEEQDSPLLAAWREVGRKEAN